MHETLPRPPRVGEMAPELELPSDDGGSISLRELRGRAVLVTFLCHAACPFSRTHLLELVERRHELERLGARVLLVGCDEPTLLAAKLMRGVAVPFELLLDEDRRAYLRWGLGRTTVPRSVLSPRLGYRYLKLLLAGEPFLGLAPDMCQLGGDFVIDLTGRVAFAHVMRASDDRASADALVRAVGRASRPAAIARTGREAATGAAPVRPS